jgi:Tfp pilus assembly protein PilV
MHPDSGTSLVEVVVAIMVVSVAVIAVMSNQPQAWITAGKSDYLGRGANLLQGELERNELWIMNPNNTVTLSSSERKVCTGGEGADYSGQDGDACYTMTTTIEQPDADVEIWRVTVSVRSGKEKALTGSVLVTRQESFRF